MQLWGSTHAYMKDCDFLLGGIQYVPLLLATLSIVLAMLKPYMELVAGYSVISAF